MIAKMAFQASFEYWYCDDDYNLHIIMEIFSNGNSWFTVPVTDSLTSLVTSDSPEPGFALSLHLKVVLS